jgi:hypothetical protein
LYIRYIQRSSLVGAQRSVHDDVPNGGENDGESRILRLDGGVRWRVSVVARLISEDITLRRESARLVLRLECLTAARPPKRASLAGASSLADVGDDVLRELIGSGGAESRRARTSEGR